MRILVTMPDTELRADFFPPRLRDRLDALGSVAYNDRDRDLTESELAERVDGVNVLVTGWGSPQVTADVLAAAADLDLIAHTGGSVANVASEAVYDAGIRVVSANDVMADHTAEHALTALLSHLRAVPTFDATMHRGEWADGETSVRTLHGKSVGLVGLGTIGRKLLEHFRPFDVDVAVYDPYVEVGALAEYPFADLVDLDAALDSEVVSVHAARTPETVGMLGADELAQIPDGAVFVNTARAEIVVEDALLVELRSGRISGVFDVYHEEPLPADHELRGMGNVLLTPHVGGSQIRPPLTESVIEDVERFAAGEDLEHAIPREQWATMTQ
jgi:phosphoglycerate dehydrogenase-like enzyme